MSRLLGTTFRMTTPWGKRRGWEIQRFRIKGEHGRIYYRITEKTACRPAGTCEVTLWRAAKLPFGTDGAIR